MGEFLKDGSVTLKKAESPINGELTVRWDTLHGYQILGGGLWQVGGPVETVWNASLSFVHKNQARADKTLILGYGGGTIMRIVQRLWKKARITGVDIDPVIVELGELYFKKPNQHVSVIIEDAIAYLNNLSESEKYTLICVDTYVGETYPEAFNGDDFLVSVYDHLQPHGVAIFNRLYDGKNRKLANEFEEKLKTIFPQVEAIYPELSVMYVCEK